MKGLYIKAFVEAITEVFREMAGIELKMTDRMLLKSPLPTNNVAVCIGVTGELEGDVVLHLESRTACKIASQMTGGMEFPQFDHIPQSAVAELGNIILGNAAKNLYGHRKEVNITPPELLVGRGLKVPMKYSPIVSIMFSADGNRVLFVQMAIEEPKG